MRQILKILLLSSFFFNLAAGLLGPIYAVFVERIGGNLIMTGGAAAAFSIVSGILIYIFAKWEDKIKHQENIIILGRLLSFIGITGYIFVQSVVHLFAVEILLGIATAFSTPAYDSLYSKNLQKGKFASQWGSWESMYSITVGIAAIIGGIVAQQYGFKVLFIAMSIITGLSLIAALLLRKDMREMFKKEGR